MVKLSSLGNIFSGLSSKPAGHAKPSSTATPTTPSASAPETGLRPRSSSGGVSLAPRNRFKDAALNAGKGKWQFNATGGAVTHSSATQSAGPAARIDEMRFDFTEPLSDAELAMMSKRSGAELDKAITQLDKAFDEGKPLVVADPGHLNPKKSWAMWPSTPKFDQTQKLRDAPPVAGAQVDSTARHAMKQNHLQASEEALIFQARVLLQAKPTEAGAPPAPVELPAELRSEREKISKHRSTLIREAAEARAELLSGLDAAPSAQAALGRAFDRLEKIQIPEMDLLSDGSTKVTNHPVEDALNQTLLAATVKRVFSAPPADAPEGAPVFDDKRAAAALDRLQNTPLASVLEQIDAAINSPRIAAADLATLGPQPSAEQLDALTVTYGHADPMLELLEALGSQPGSPRRLAQLMGLPKSTLPDPADPSLRLKVAIDALRAFSEAKRASPDGQVSEAQKAWLSNAVQHARRLVDPTAPLLPAAMVERTNSAAARARVANGDATVLTTSMICAMVANGDETMRAGGLELLSESRIAQIADAEAERAKAASQAADEAVREAAVAARKSAALAGRTPQDAEAAERAKQDHRTWEAADASALELREAAQEAITLATEERHVLLLATSAAFESFGSPKVSGIGEVSAKQVQGALAESAGAMDELSAAQTEELGAATQLKVAYRAVQNGLVTKEPGSLYDSMNKELQRLDADLAVVRARNVRRATNLTGDAVNWVSGAMPAWVGGTKALAMRRKALREGVKAIVNAGLMLPLDEVRGTLGKNGAEITKRIDTRLKSLADRRELGVLPLSSQEEKEFGIGMATKGILETTATLGKVQAKNMGPEIFYLIESQGAEGHLEALGEKFMAEWNRMKTEGPNVGQVLALLAEHVDLEGVMADNVALKLRDEPLTFKQRLENTGKVTTRAVEAFTGLATTLSDKIALTVQKQGEIEIASETVALDELQGLSALAAEFTRRMTSLSPPEKRNHVPPSVFREIQFELGDRFPKDLDGSWMELGTTGPDAGTVMRLLQDKIEDALKKAPEGLQNEMKPELKGADRTLRLQQRQIHVERFRGGVADAVLSYADMREPRDVREMFDAITAKTGTAEKLKFGEVRTGSVDPFGLVSALVSVVTAPIGFTAGFSGGWSKAKERSIDVNMHGGSMQVWIAKGVTNALFGGPKGGISPMEPVKNILRPFGVKIDAVAFQGKAEVSHESTKYEGVGLRVDRKGGHEEWMQRDMAAVLGDLADPAALMQRQHGLDEGDLIGALLNEHPLLIVDGIRQDKEIDKGEVGVAFIPLRMDLGKNFRVGASVGPTHKVQAGTTLQYEEGGATQVTEKKVESQSRAEVKTEAYAQFPWAIADANNVDEEKAKRTKTKPKGEGLVDSNPAGGVSYVKTIHNTGSSYSEREIRHGGPTGNTFPNESKYSFETEDFDKYLSVLGESNAHALISHLVKWDPTPGRTDLEKFAVAERRLPDLLNQFGQNTHPDIVFGAAPALRESAGIATDAIEALADEARRAGDVSKGDAYDQSRNALRTDKGSWTNPMLLMRSKAKSERGAGVPSVFTSKGAGEATKVQSMQPWRRANVVAQPASQGRLVADQSELATSSGAGGSDNATPSSDTRGSDNTQPSSDTRGSDNTRPSSNTRGSDNAQTPSDTRGSDANPSSDTGGSDSAVAPRDPLPPAPPSSPVSLSSEDARSQELRRESQTSSARFPSNRMGISVNGLGESGYLGGDSDSSFGRSDVAVSGSNQSVRGSEPDFLRPIDRPARSQSDIGPSRTSRQPWDSDEDVVLQRMQRRDTAVPPAGSGQGRPVPVQPPLDRTPSRPLPDMTQTAASPQGPSLQDVSNQPEGPRGPSLQELFNRPEEPESPPRDAPKVTLREQLDRMELEEMANETVRRHALSLRTAVDGVANPQEREVLRQALQPELTAELVNAGLSDDAALQQALARSKADAERRRPSQPPLRIGEPVQGTGPVRARREVEGKGKAIAIATEESSSDKE